MRRQIQIKGERKTHDEYVAELTKKNPDIEVVGKYINARTKILHRCTIDGFEWEAIPQNMLRSCKCPLCRKVGCNSNKRRTHEEYVGELHKINSNLQVIETYQGSGVPILHRCLIDGYEWKIRPNSILNGGRGCPICSGYCRERWSQDKYIKLLGQTHPNITVIDKYINNKTPILHRCEVCDYEWYAPPRAVLYGTGCPLCAKKSSQGERKIREWLDKHYILYQSQYSFRGCVDIIALRFDFYLPSYNSCIEFDGLQHREPIDFFGGYEAFKTLVKHDEIKNKYCELNNIKLLRLNDVKDIDLELNNFLFE